MKRLVIILLGTCLLLSACASGSSESSKDVSGEKKTVTISVTMKDRFLETAALKFEETHPNINIEFKENLSLPSGAGDGAIDLNKYVQTVTTEALAGNASDIIAMGYLPVDKFVQKNMLVDLYGLMSKDSAFDKNQYYKKIMEASQTGDGLYAMPVSFSTSAMQGKSDLLEKANVSINDTSWTWDDFKNITLKVNEKADSDYSGMISAFPEQMLYDFIEENYSELVQPEEHKAKFDSKMFIDKMKQVKSMYDEGILSNGELTDLDKGLFTDLNLSSPKESLTQLLNPNTLLLRKPTESGTFRGGSFNSYSTFGINSKSKVQQEAWEFIKFLLSEDMQSSPEMSGLPLNKAVTEKELNSVKQQIQDGQIELPDGSDEKLLDERIDLLKTFLEETGVNIEGDMKIKSFALEELRTYMSGQKSAEEVSNLLQNRVMTYLNE
ncbi:ABC transporter substrate-binding protein [Paenibacillus lutimineralis]|nr:ABC transporter substrate-binding protein [Paenibacillus lutimineralis]